VRQLSWERMSWERLGPRYAELAGTALSEDMLPAWLSEWSRLSDLLEETRMRLWIECMRDTTSAERTERRRRFEDRVSGKRAAMTAKTGYEPTKASCPSATRRCWPTGS
jgi:hypothetical protein